MSGSATPPLTSWTSAPPAPRPLHSPPTSTMSAPCATSSRPCAMAASAPYHRPPSEKESGVTFTTPMTSVRATSGGGGPPPPPPPPRRGGRPVPPTAIGERVRRDVHHAHDQRACYLGGDDPPQTPPDHGGAARPPVPS